MSKKRNSMLLMPIRKTTNNKDNMYPITESEEYILKYMNNSCIINVYTHIGNIKDIEFELINNKNIHHTFETNPVTSLLYNIIYNDNKNRKFEITYKVVKINKITLLDSNTKTFDHLYFYQSKGISRNYNTKDYWFPTDNSPFQLDLNGNLDRLSKLEDNILVSKYNHNQYNISKYGRFLTEENSLISKYLFNLNLK